MNSIVACSKFITVHEYDNEEPFLKFAPHKGNINSAIYNHNNQVIASCSSDSNIVLSHATKGFHLLTLEDKETLNSGGLTSISITSSSLLLASGGTDSLIKIWDLKKKSLLSKYKSHFGSITSVAWHSNDQILASSSIVGDIVLHNITNGLPISNFHQKGSNGVRNLKFSPFVKHFLGAGGNDGSICIWDINSRVMAANFNQSHGSRVNALAFSGFNQSLMCSAGLDQNINFYDIYEKKVVKTICTDAPLTSLAFNNDGHTVVVGTLYGGMLLYDLRASQNIKTKFNGHDNNSVNWVEFSKPSEKNKENIDKSMESVKEREQDSIRSIGERESVKSTKINKQLEKESLNDISQISNAEFKPSNALDELKTKLSNLEIMRKDSFMKVDRKKVEEPSIRNTFTKSEIKPEEKKENPIKIIENISKNNVFPNILNENDFGRSENTFEKSKMNLLQTIDVNNKKISDKMNQEIEFSEKQKEYLRELLFIQKNDIKDAMQDYSQNLHLEIIRQFQIQQMEFSNMLEKHMNNTANLMKEISDLKAENNFLKKITY